MHEKLPNYLTTVFISLPTSPGEICQTSRGILFPGTGIPPNGGHNDVRWPQREGGLPPGAPLDDLPSGASPSSTVMPMLKISSTVSGIGLTVWSRSVFSWRLTRASNDVGLVSVGEMAIPIFPVARTLTCQDGGTVCDGIFMNGLTTGCGNCPKMLSRCVWHQYLACLLLDCLSLSGGSAYHNEERTYLLLSSLRSVS